MNKIEFKLKQHTPIIHFLHDQPGATLRATELKPKLDKFLIKHAYKDDFDKYKTHLIGWKEGEKKQDFDEKFSFDYKITIDTGGQRPVETRYNRSLYFGHMGNKDPKKAVKMDHSIALRFFSFDFELLKKINEYFPSFIARTNFGTRQNKSFGSFFIEEPRYNFIEELKKTVPWFLYIEYPSKGREVDRFNDIDIIYKIMKSGINYPDHVMIDYVKDGKTKQRPDYDAPKKGNAFKINAYLPKYFGEKPENIGSEKRFIKEKFFSPSVRISSDGRENRYIRAFLGICDGVEYKGKERKGKISYKSSIERFKSPITFKIVDNFTVIIPENFPGDELGDLEFSFSHNFGKEPNLKTSEYKICTPTSTTFDLIDFLKKYSNYFNKLSLSELAGKKSQMSDMIRNAKQSTLNIYEKGGK